jgi:hypothetical protein
MKNLTHTKTSSRLNFASREQRHSAAFNTAVGHAFVALLTIFVGWLALSNSSAQIPEWANLEDAYCMRLHRGGDAPMAVVAVGTPARVLKVLLNIGRVDSGPSALTLFADELLRSDTLQCEADRTCSDVSLLVNDTLLTQLPFQIEFRYANYFDDEFYASREAGAEGELRLAPDTLYKLTSTHFCLISKSSMETPIFDENAQQIAAHVHEDGQIFAEASAISPEFPAASCNGSVQLFPLDAINERSWLALSSSFLFESSTNKLTERRAVVEQSLSCAPNSSEKEIYNLDCDYDGLSQCQSTPSIPFRRMSQDSVSIYVNIAGTGVNVWYTKEAALSRLQGSLTISEEVLFSSLRLVVLLIVAFVVFTRTERQTASAHHCIVNALGICAGKDTRQLNLVDQRRSDALVGALAIISRIGVLILQAQVMVADGGADTVLLESIGIAASASHFVLRNFVLTSDNKTHSPIQALGGSMAVADASIAALVSVTTLPLLQANYRNFGAVARLFSGVLIGLFVFHRAWFAFNSCLMLGQTTASNDGFDRRYSVVLWTAALLWILQISSASFAFSRLFCVPQAYSLSRALAGTPNTVEAAVLLLAFSSTIPLVNSVLVKITKI